MSEPWESCKHEAAWKLAGEERVRQAEVAAGTITSKCLICGLRVGFSWGNQEPWTQKGYVRTDVTPTETTS